MTEETIEEPTPLLCLDVNLGNGVSPQIIINEGEDIDYVAEKFAQ
jgi:hypothetical protein